LDAQPALREGRDTEARQLKARRERDATPDLLSKHPNVTFTTYVSRQMKHLKHASETLAKTLQNHCKT
jgi:predicted RNase H-like nuclease